MKLVTSRLTLVSLVVVGCGGGGGGGEGSTELVGAATYRDAATAHDGTAQEPSTPPAQSARVFVTVEGNGQIPNIDPQCSLDPAGRFEANYVGTLSLDNDSAYASSFGNAATSIVTPSGCTIPELTAVVVTDVKVRGELDATTQNCDTYCSAAARAQAEDSCGASASAATCRSDAETSATASCKTTCTTQTHVIVAETSLGAAAIGQVDANKLRAAALGQIDADLTFDHMEDADGNVIDF